ncbi:hypothetical protein ACFE04_030945 [Oxalis oulophora]
MILAVSFRYSSTLTSTRSSIELTTTSTTNRVDNLLSFVQSSITNELQGSSHCWLNKVEEIDNEIFSGNKTVLVVASQFLHNSRFDSGKSTSICQNIKAIQQRFPQLFVMGLQFSSSICSEANESNLAQLIMSEYITFPILLSNNNFFKVENETQYILFKDFTNPVVYNEHETDLAMLIKAVEELNEQDNEKSTSVDNLKSTWVKPVDIIKEPYLSSVLQNLLLYFPGCISADETGGRLFISDSNHHRIIISDEDGKILDCIGSCPGFEDGEFECAKMVRPTSSIYDDTEDCLYIVDSENNAIRRADMGRKVLETLYPTNSFDKKKDNWWTRLMSKFHSGKDDVVKSGEFDPESVLYPWHLMKSDDNHLFIINRSFETLWIMDLHSGKISETIKGLSKILDRCGEFILEKVSLLKQMPPEWLQQQSDNNPFLKELPYSGLISSFTASEDHIFMCDLVGQRVLKFNKESGDCSNLQLSNFGVLGLPYWLSPYLERVYAIANGIQGVSVDHFQYFNLLPGKLNIQLKVSIPSGTQLVEALQDGCILRQARGSATEVSGSEASIEASDKVGVAQQWYDELDNLAYVTPDPELITEDNNNTTTELAFQDDRVHINYTANTSPGKSEVIIYAALYLKLSEDAENNQEKYAGRIADILNSGRSPTMTRDSTIQFLLKSNTDLRDLIFMKPLHVRIRVDSSDHPKAENQRDIILTDSSIEVSVSL